MRCLITGATGFLGSHLVDDVRQRGGQVTVLVRDMAEARRRWPTGLRIESAELTDRIALEAVLHRCGPDLIFHLAAQTYPLASWQDPQGTFRTNLTGAVALLEGVRAWGGGTRIMVTGSSAAYGCPADGHPIKEDEAPDPISPYGVSKLAVNAVAALYGHRYGLPVVQVRPFYIIGPRKTGDACSDFARRIVRAERTGRPDVPVGNLDMVRDLLDIRDALDGMWTAVTQGQPGEAYNLCSGRGYALREVLDQLKQLAALPVSEVLDPSLLRPVDEPVKIGDPGKLMALGWTPRIGLAESLRAILDYWRSNEGTV